jgi:hypothetical protein
MPLPDGESMTNDEITSLWKEVNAASSDVEQHRLKCAISVNITNSDDMIGGKVFKNSHTNIHLFITEYFINGHMNNDAISAGYHNLSSPSSTGIKSNNLQATINHHLNENILQMQNQMKSLQSLQWITIFVFIMLAIAIVYILKMEIQNQNSQYCIDK